MADSPDLDDLDTDALPSLQASGSTQTPEDACHKTPSHTDVTVFASYEDDELVEETVEGMQKVELGEKDFLQVRSHDDPIFGASKTERPKNIVKQSHLVLVLYTKNSKKDERFSEDLHKMVKAQPPTRQHCVRPLVTEKYQAVPDILSDVDPVSWNENRLPQNKKKLSKIVRHEREKLTKVPRGNVSIGMHGGHVTGGIVIGKIADSTNHPTPKGKSQVNIGMTGGHITGGVVIGCMDPSATITKTTNRRVINTGQTGNISVGDFTDGHFPKSTAGSRPTKYENRGVINYGQIGSLSTGDYNTSPMQTTFSKQEGMSEMHHGHHGGWTGSGGAQGGATFIQKHVKPFTDSHGNYVVDHHQTINFCSTPQTGSEPLTAKKKNTLPITKCVDEPDLKQMGIVAAKIGCQWMDLGRRLNIGDGELDTLKLNYKDTSQEEVVHQTLRKWKEESDSPATVAALAQACNDVGRGDIADELTKSC